MLFQTTHDPIYIHQKVSYNYIPHAHHNLELLLCLAGTCQATCNFRTEVLRPGDVMIAFSNDIHSYTETTGGMGMTVIVDPSLISNFTADLQQKQYENFLLQQKTSLIPLADALFHEYQGDKNKQILLGYIYIILGNILKTLPWKEQNNAVDAMLFSQILNYLSENYTKHISLKSMGERFGISTAHLSRTFKQKFSCGFLQYLHILRVEHAKNLLEYSQLRILDIALESGFSDSRTFNRVFLEHTGVTPRAYRVAHTGVSL